MLMQLDDFQFSIGTAAYEQLRRRSEARWARIPLLGGGEAIHTVGVNNDTITLTGTVYPQIAQQVKGNTSITAIDRVRRNAQRTAGRIAQGAQLINRLLNNNRIENLQNKAQQLSGQVGTEAIDTLRDLLYDRLPLLLLSADGFSLGYWIILSLDNIDSNYIRSIPRQQQFQITIQYYGETAQ